mmetsp:Transcript_90859/g.166770  ORF Transcript_90859/g.166770 Transcript_90859/m.166770 type:complete len:334 (-) Transcript_90859:131-1132(-)
MLKVVFALLACAAPARRLQGSIERWKSTAVVEESRQPMKSAGRAHARGERDSRNASAALLLASTLASLYNPSAPVRRALEPKRRVVAPPRMARIYYQGDNFANEPQPADMSNAAYGVPDDAEEVCLLLPNDDYLGEAPAQIGGEMELAEMEDSSMHRTQIWLNPDGTVTLGQSEGPPHVDSCGLWQCGSDDFQMTLQRRFSNDLSLEPDDPDASFFTVTRTYTGLVNSEGTGVDIVSGSMHFYHYENDATADIGYFSLASNEVVAADGKDRGGEVYDGDPTEEEDLPKNPLLQKLLANPKAEFSLEDLLDNDVDGVFTKAKAERDRKARKKLL